MEREFRYYPDDFAKLPVKVLYMDLVFDMFETQTKTSSKLRARAFEDLSELKLDAKNLEILSVSCDKSKTTFNYDKENSKLIVKFEEKIPSGEEFVISTETICHPTKNILEGLYYDETINGNPPQMITQCQQWGFQRLVPCIDDMAAKTTFTTKIIADSRYTHLISNGDVIVPRKDLGNGRSEIVYENKKVPMATYLFFLGVGTFDSYKKEVEYPNGKKFAIELLVLPNSSKVACEKALQFLWHGITWVYLFTGNERYKDVDKKLEILKLVEELETAKSENNESKVNALRPKVAALANGLKFGYEYTGSVYREIAMQNSNFGGMENVGNTTITANRMIPTKDTTDGMVEYLFSVKVHEFFHNQNGSEVTGKSPFELWLNEAVTCHVERWYHEFISGNHYARLSEVLHIVAPGGTFDFDSGSTTMPIVAKGFNTPDDLISNVTYSKAPEFVRMVETTIGRENFVKGLWNYYARFKHSNATSKQWIEEMERASGLNLQGMADSWLNRTGFPIVKVDKHFDGNSLTLKLTQTNLKGRKPWQFPFVVGLVGSNGNDFAEKTFFVGKGFEELVFENVKQPKVVSLARGFSFYGKVVVDLTNAELLDQVYLDRDLVNKYFAFYKIAGLEKTRLLDNPNAEVSAEFLELFYWLLSNEDLTEQMGSLLLSITDDVEDEKKRHYYQELFEVVKKIEKAIATKYGNELFAMYLNRRDRTFTGGIIEKFEAEAKNRQVKNSCLSILSSLDTPKVHDLIKKQFESAQTATDKIVAFRLYIETSAQDKMEFISKFEDEASKSLILYEAFLSSIGGTDAKEALDLIKKTSKSKHFRIEQTNDQRALFMRFAYNKRLSLQTGDGREYLKEILLTLSHVNEYAAVNAFSVFGQIDLMQEKYHLPLGTMLVDILKELEKNKEENISVCNTIKRLLKGAPKVIAAYEKANGKLSL